MCSDFIMLHIVAICKGIIVVLGTCVFVYCKGLHELYIYVLFFCLGRNNNPSGKLIAAATTSSNTDLLGGGPKLTPQQEAEKEKKRIARKKERRATLILGLIMGSFIACWFPFFFLYSISPIW